MKLIDVIHKTETINPQKNPDSGFEYIDVSSICNKRFVIQETSTVLGKDAPSRARKLVRTGDVLFATVRPTLKRIAQVPEYLDGQVCSTGYFVLRPKEFVEGKFLFYFLFTEHFMGAMEGLQKGASYPAVNDGEVSSQTILLPPIDEQKRIVGILDEAFEDCDRVIRNTEKNLANSRKLFESYLNAIFTQKEDTWVEKKLGDAELIQIIDGDRGTNYPQKSDFYPEGYCLFLNTKNVRPDGFNFDTTMFITEEKDNLLRKGKLKRRDVILTTRGTIGNIAIYDDNVEFDHIRINSGMLVFRPNEKIIKSEYLFEILRSALMKSQIKKFTSGAAQPQLPIKTLVNFSLPVPKKLEDQSQIISNLQELYTETQRLETIYKQKLTALKELKQSILQKAFTGKLATDSLRC